MTLSFGRPWALAAFFALAAPQAAHAEVGLREQVCAMIESAAAAHGLPAAFLTRLIWRESAFRSNSVSPKGAQGIAQFMPGVAAERGLADPFDPEQAIPKAAELLAELRAKFGNLGLAAAAYNGGAKRVADWLAGSGGMPAETRDFVEIITRRPVEDWKDGAAAGPALGSPNATCLQTAALIGANEPRSFAGSTLTAPWGVQIAGAFNRAAALATYGRAQRALGALLAGEPMIIGKRAPGRGFARFWRVRAPAQSRGEAEALCKKIHAAHGACVVLKT
jgi:hypothetical protein